MSWMLGDLLQDVRYGIRGVRLNPGTSLAIVVTLALGIGANAAMFSVLDALMLRPLPYEQPEELVELRMIRLPNDLGGPSIPYEVASGWRESQDLPVMLHSRATVLYTGGTEPRTLPVQVVAPEFNQMFGVAPVRGREMLPEDAKPASPNVALIDYGFWKTEFGRDPAIIGRTITLNGIGHAVIGVMPSEFKFPTYSTTEVWVPFRSDGTVLGRSARGSWIEAAMRSPEAEREAQNARAAAVGSVLFRELDPASEHTLRLHPMEERRGGNDDDRRAMILLSGAVGLILLVAGVNMANLLLARGTTRMNEMAVRRAIGATRGRIVRQIATEAILLALMGGLAAVWVAQVMVGAIQGIIPSSIMFWAAYAVAIEQRTLLFTFAVAVASGLVFGVLPALTATNWSGAASDAALTRSAAATRTSRRVRSGLVVVEVAFSVALLITASLLINSFVRLVRVDPGMELDDMAVLQFSVSPNTYPTDAERGSYLRRLEDRIASVPGVESVTLTGGLPPHTSISFDLALEPEGGVSSSLPAGTVLPHTEVGPEFFAVTGARLLAGRGFLSGEAQSSGNVIVDEDLAAHLWPHARAVGRRFRLEPDAEWLTVVGVMADLRLLGPDERLGEFSLIHPIGPYEDIGGQLAMAIRTRGGSRQVLAGIRAAVRDVDANQPIQELVPATTYYGEAVDMPRFLAVLMGVLAALALALAAIGIHGVLAFGVAQRRHELGVRMVLGAGAGELGRMVVGEGLLLALMGIGLGIGGSLLSTRIVQSVLYGVAAADMSTFVASIATVLVITVAATLRSARRAARLDPLEVIRSQ